MGRTGGKASYGAARTRGSVAGAAPRRGRLDDVFRTFVRLLRANLSPSVNTTAPLSVESCRNPFEALPEVIEKPVDGLGIFDEVDEEEVGEAIAEVAGDVEAVGAAHGEEV